MVTVQPHRIPRANALPLAYNARQHLMFEQAFRNIDDILRKEAGCTTELDYTEQTSWLLFLKYLDGLEQDRADEAGETTARPLMRPLSSPRPAGS